MGTKDTEGKEVIPDKTTTGPVTDDELEGLSAEERAALEADDDDADALNEIANDDDPDAAADAEAKAAAAAEAKAKAAQDAKDKAAQEAADKERQEELAAMTEEERKAAEAADKTAKETAAAEKAAADEKARQAAATDDEEEDEFAPAFKAPAPEKYDERMKELDDRHAAAVRDYNDNKITLDEMLAEHQKVDRERRELDGQKLKHEISSAYTEQTSDQLWQREVRRFVSRTAKDEGIDYDKPALNAALDAEVKRIANDPANADKDGKWILEKAHESVKEQFGITARAPTAKEDADKAKRAAEEQRKKAAAAERAKAAGTKNLSQVPAAAAEDTRNDTEFAHLDQLDGMDLENAVARMSPEAQERWARQ